MAWTKPFAIYDWLGTKARRAANAKVRKEYDSRCLDSLRGETRRGKLRWAHEFGIAGEGHRFTRVESCRPWPSLLSFWSLNSGARGVVYIHFLVIGVVGDAAFPRASARLCFWFPCLEGEEPRLCCTKCMRCDILGKGDSKRPAKKKKSHAIIQFGLFTYFSICDFTPRKSMVSCNIHGPLVFQPSLMARATAAGFSIPVVPRHDVGFHTP